MKVVFGESPITLLSYYVPELTYKAQKGLNFEPAHWLSLGPADIQVTIGYSEPDEDHGWRFEVKVEPADGAVFAYDFRVFVAGEFRVSQDLSDQEGARLAHVNAPSMLYSIARELLVDATSRSPFPPIMLPTIRFVPDDKSEKKTRKASEVGPLDKGLKNKSHAKPRKVKT